jgi:hypothetical protein
VIESLTATMFSAMLVVLMTVETTQATNSQTPAGSPSSAVISNGRGAAGVESDMDNRTNVCVDCGQSCKRGAVRCKSCNYAYYTTPLGERLWRHIDRRGPDECWPWKGKRTRGYGITAIGRHGLLAHRVVWETVYGPIPQGLCVCHRCDHPECCNPKHLWLGTHDENMTDMSVKGRTSRQRGESNASHKLTEPQVVELRRKQKAGESYASLAVQFGISETTVWEIAGRRTWIHIAD